VRAAPAVGGLRPGLGALRGAGSPVSLYSYQPATLAYALSRGVAYLTDVRGFPDAAVYPQLARSSAKLVVMHSVQDGQADRREAPAGDIMDHIAAFFDARIAAPTGAGIKPNRLVLDPGPGFFLGAAPHTPHPVLAPLPTPPPLSTWPRPPPVSPTPLLPPPPPP
ncbi:hypothetical protein DNP02_23955, partial [Salmonella enterica subsp. enterica serovar Panama]